MQHIGSYNAIYDDMVKTGSGLKYLDHQLGWFGKAYSPEDNIAKQSGYSLYPIMRHFAYDCF